MRYAIELEDSEIERLVSEVCARDAIEGGVAVAINLLFSYLRPEHEQRLAAALRAALPGVAVSCSHEVAPIWREYERGNTVIVDAYLRRLTGRFAERLDEGLTEVGLRCPRFLLKSNGGQIPVDAGVPSGGRLRDLRPGGRPDRGQALRRGIRVP